MAHEDDPGEKDVAVVRELIALFKLHAEELRAKGLDVDEMIRTLEEQVEEVLAAARHVRELEVADRHLTEKREHLRKSIDALPGLPPDLVDGMATIPYLQGALEREVERKRQGRKGPAS